MLFSSCITVVITAIQLYQKYNSGVSQVEDQVAQIETLSLPGLTGNLWNMYEKQVRLQLDELVRMPNVSYMEIRSRGEVIASAGHPTNDNAIARTSPIIYQRNNEAIPIGEFLVIATLDNVYDDIINTAFSVLIANGIKTGAVSLFIFFLFQYLITRHLIHISQHVKKISSTNYDQQITLERRFSNDELQLLVSSINAMKNKLLQEEVERVNAEKHIRSLSTAIEQSPVSVMITNPVGHIEYVNNTFEQVTGYNLSDVAGQTPRLLKSENTPPSRYQEMWQKISSGQSWQGELENCKKDGELYWENMNIAPVLDDSGSIAHYVAVKQDITEKKRQDKLILQQAYYDTLTKLPNRFLAMDRLSQSLKEAQRNNNKAAVLFLDLDHFKVINDSLGHEAGDDLLQQVAIRLGNSLRNEDTVGRLGGDEFIILIDGLTHAREVQFVADSILNSLSPPFIIGERDYVITASIGISVYPSDGETTSELLRNADTAMYESKKGGRNTYRFFSDKMNKKAARRLTLEEQLHGALERKELSVHYQPLVDIKKQQVVGAEALLRWHNQELGYVSPDEFIPIAEHTGLITSVGQYVLTTALNTTAKFRDRYNDEFSIAVNISPVQFRDPNLSTLISDTLQQQGLDGSALELEITEGVLLEENSNIGQSLSAIRALGVSLSMDDFGTGYSSLSYLQKYPFNTLKIDRSFVNDICNTKASDSLLLINAIVSMAHGMRLKVIAEGVETEEQLNIIIAQQCDLVQGYYFSRPLSEDQFIKYLDTYLLSHD